MRNKTEAKKGYKKTKLGWIPEEWEVINFSSVFNFIQTVSYSRVQLTIKNDEDNITYNIHYGDIHSTYKSLMLDFDKEDNIPVLKNNVSIPKNVSYLKDGDLVIADASEDYEGVGACIELKNVRNRKVIGGLHTHVARDENNKTAPGYRCYILKNKEVTKELWRIATGISVYGVSKSNLQKVKIPVPTLKEQQKIAQILSTWDRAIEKYELLIKKYELRKKGLMQQLLTKKKRFTGFIEKWKEIRLEKVFEMKAGKDLDISNFSEIKDESHTYPVFSNSLENNGLYGWYNTFQYKGGKITVTARGTLGIAKPRIEKFNAIGRVLILIPKISIDIKFVSEYINNKTKIYVESTGVPQLTAPQFKTYKIQLPPIEEQQKIASVLSAADKEIEVFRQQLEKLKEQKKGLMQVLLTGKVRVKIENQ